MEFFDKAVAVRLKTHMDKYLVADDDQVSVRQSHSARETRRARWLVEHVDSNSHVIRLKSCYGRYLTASKTPFLMGMSGKKVIQTENDEKNSNNELAIEWQPVRDGFQVKLKACCDGTYLRANGAMPPWRNTITHDHNNTYNNNWILFDVEAVDVPDDEEFNDYVSLVSSFSSVSDELSVLEFGVAASPTKISSSPVNKHFSSYSFSPRWSPMFSFNKQRVRSFQQETTPATTTTRSGVMDLFRNAKAVRLKNIHNKYLHAEDDEESVSQDRNGSSKNNRWTVEFVTNHQDDDITIIRLKSCYNKYLTASNQPFLLGMTGRKVMQTVPRRLDSSVEWEPIREGNQVKLRTRYGQYLRANGGLPPWRNSVTHDVPHRTATQEWVLWDIDVVDIVVQSPAPGPPPPLVYHSAQDHSNDDSFTSSETSSSPRPDFSRQQSSDSHHHSSTGSPPKFEDGRAIYYHVISEDFGEMDENAQGFCITFKGNNVNDLTHKLEEETGLNDITVCTRSPLNGKLYPLRLQLPPNNVTMKVVVVQNSMEDAIDCF
ncbi:Actin cross-linking [Artemisia annua]|uniref:Actin cross-linking n=1 Tax=Artemisia annua TaxID=35608 RepID=A0A2U1KME7_ARTAN|nr:Actin cross-linking [Artemisia annua]